MAYLTTLFCSGNVGANSGYGKQLNKREILMVIKICGFGLSRGCVFANTFWGLIKKGPLLGGSKFFHYYHWREIRITVERQRQPGRSIEIIGAKSGRLQGTRRLISFIRKNAEWFAGKNQTVRIKRNDSSWVCRFPRISSRRRKKFLPFHVFTKGLGPK